MLSLITRVQSHKKKEKKLRKSVRNVPEAAIKIF
jgi:hypothetical protein